MNVHLSHIFGQALRLNADGELMTPDGRTLSTSSRGFALAQKLFDIDPEKYAEEIVKLMVPFCYRLDQVDIVEALKAFGREYHGQSGRQDAGELQTNDLGDNDHMSEMG